MKINIRYAVPAIKWRLYKMIQFYVSQGVLGSGLLTSNLSNESLSAIINFSELLVDLYKGTKYNDFKGDLCREIIEIKNNVGDFQKINY